MLASKLGINIYVGFGVEGASPSLKRKPFSAEYTRQDERSFGVILGPLLLHGVCVQRCLIGDVRSYNAAIMRLGSEDKISVTSKDSSKLYFFFS